MPHTFKHHAAWVSQLASKLEAEGHDAEALLAQVGLTKAAISAPDARVPFAKCAGFFEVAAATLGDPCLGLHFGQNRDTRDAGPLGYLALAAPTLGEGIRSFCRYRRVFSDALQIELEEKEGCAQLRWRFHGARPEDARQSLEFAATNFVRAFRDATGSAFFPRQVALIHSRSADLDEFHVFFGPDIRFGQPENIIEVAAADLQRPHLQSDHRLQRIMGIHCNDLLKEQIASAPSLRNRVEHRVAPLLAHGEAKVERVAKEVGMSTRSLTRRLAETGTSFGEVVQEFRKKLAFRYLREESLSLPEIAFLLGYRDVSSFTHSFKRWTGTTPARFRRDGPANN